MKDAVIKFSSCGGGEALTLLCRALKEMTKEHFT